MAPSLGKMLDAAGNPVTEMPGEMAVSTAGVIRDGDGAVLLQKRSDNGLWSLPGGVLDIGESVTQGVIRETFEETGLNVTVKRLVGVYSDPRRYSIMNYPNGQRVHFVSLVFECEHQSGELRISDESTDIGYFHADAFPDGMMASARQRIEDALEARPESFVR